MQEHKTKTQAGFAARYQVDKLVWYSAGEDMLAAIEVEKKIKHRGRQWKIELIERTNPEWRDLSLDFLDSAD